MASACVGEGDTIADMFVVAAADDEVDDEVGEDEGEEGEDEEDRGDGSRKLIAVTQRGFGKRVLVSRFKRQRRGGKGVIAIKFKDGVVGGDRLLALSPVSEDEELLLITQRGTIVRQRINAISVQGRATTGVALQKLDDDDLVASVAIVPIGEEVALLSRQCSKTARLEISLHNSPLIGRRAARRGRGPDWGGPGRGAHEGRPRSRGQ